MFPHADGMAQVCLQQYGLNTGGVSTMQDLSFEDAVLTAEYGVEGMHVELLELF